MWLKNPEGFLNIKKEIGKKEKEGGKEVIYLVDNVPAGLFIDLGVGFALIAISIILSKK